MSGEKPAAQKYAKRIRKLADKLQLMRVEKYLTVVPSTLDTRPSFLPLH